MVITNNRRIKNRNQVGHFTPSKQAISSHFHIKAYLHFKDLHSTNTDKEVCTGGGWRVGDLELEEKTAYNNAHSAR